MNVYDISKDLLLVSLVTNRVSPEEVSSQLWRSELLVEHGDKLLGRWERAYIVGNCFVLCLTFCSAINSFNGAPQLGDICLLLQGLNKISKCLPFVCVNAVLDVIIQSWQFGRGVVSFTEVISSCHHIQYFCWYRFLILVEPDCKLLGRWERLCRLVGMWCDDALSRTVWNIFSSLLQSVGREACSGRPPLLVCICPS